MTPPNPLPSSVLLGDPDPNLLDLSQKVAWDGSRLAITSAEIVARLRRPALSPSTAKAMSDCTARWVIEKLLPDTEDPFGAAAIGTSAHAVLEALYSLPRAERSSLRAMSILDAHSRAMWPADDPRTVAQRTLWVTEVSAAFSGIFDIEDPSQIATLAVEKDFSGIEVGGVPIRGFIDRVDEVTVERDGALVRGPRVVDYKSGSLPRNIAQFGDPHGDQLRLYGKAVEAMTGQMPVAVEIFYTRHGKRKVVAMSKTAVNKTVRSFTWAWAELNAHLDDAAFPTKAGPLCGFCPAVKSCPVASGEFEDRTHTAPEAVLLGIPTLRPYLGNAARAIQAGLPAGLPGDGSSVHAPPPEDPMLGVSMEEDFDMPSLDDLDDDTLGPIPDDTPVMPLPDDFSVPPPVPPVPTAPAVPKAAAAGEPQQPEPDDFEPQPQPQPGTESGSGDLGTPDTLRTPETRGAVGTPASALASVPPRAGGVRTAMTADGRFVVVPDEPEPVTATEQPASELPTGDEPDVLGEPAGFDEPAGLAEHGGAVPQLADAAHGVGNSASDPHPDQGADMTVQTVQQPAQAHRQPVNQILFADDAAYREVVNDRLNGASYAASACFGTVSMAYAALHEAGIPISRESIDSLASTFAKIVGDVQRAFYGRVDFQAGLNTRLRGALHSYMEAHPLPWGGDAQAWDRWVALGVSHVTGITSAALRLYEADQAQVTQPWLHFAATAPSAPVEFSA